MLTLLRQSRTSLLLHGGVASSSPSVSSLSSATVLSGLVEQCRASRYSSPRASSHPSRLSVGRPASTFAYSSESMSVSIPSEVTVSSKAWTSSCTFYGVETSPF